MSTRKTTPLLPHIIVFVVTAAFVIQSVCHTTQAKQNIREAFFNVYPDAIGTTIETVPSHSNHCGVCHYEFGGGGTRNPYGARLEEALGSFPNNPNGRQQAVQSIENEDPDGDSFSTLIEVTDVTTFANTPTFPGLTPANVGNTSSVDLLEIQDYLVPSTGGDTTPPTVTVIKPNGGESFEANKETSVEWSATDSGGIAGVDLYVSVDNGATYRTVAMGLPNTGLYTWFIANRPTTQAIFRVVATDNSFNQGQDESDDVFTIYSPSGGIAPTTLRDFDQPGSQPFEAGILNPPGACQVCHGNYDINVEPYHNWEGSMMSQASRDLLFEACMAVGNQDAPDSGDLCLRCHLPRGWLRGRSIPTDGSQMLDTDMSGVSCDLCHRLVDPFYDPGQNPPEDQDILADLSSQPTNVANGMYIVDPTGARRGPFVNADSGHPILVSPFHREAALCGTCHDVSNPAFEKDGGGNYPPNAFDTAAADFSSHTLMPIERTYSEWFYSEYNTPTGVYAPQFGGNQDYVATCQDCHMRDVTGQGCNFGTPPIRDDLPLHDITGGSTWFPGLLSSLYPGEVNEAALLDGIARAQYMLQNAATVGVVPNGSLLEVTVTNETGHKLPTGYPEGRRMWINVIFYDSGMNVIAESGAYDPATGILSQDPELKIYEAKPGLDDDTAGLVGVAPGPSFHFVLNNKIFKDTRIPPRGFANASYDSFGGAPVGTTYADGQYWDLAVYTIPLGAAGVDVTLYYQSTSKEFVEFLRDENFTNSKGQELFDLWNGNDKCPPEIMWSSYISLLSAPPDAPSQPSGPVSGYSGIPYDYSSSTTDPDGDQVYYWFDWGDGTNSGWLGPFDSGQLCTAGNSWATPGLYQVKVKAKDINNVESAWSPDLSVDIADGSHILLRQGNVNSGIGVTEDVMFINGSIGDAEREMTVTQGTMLTGSMQRSSAGPNPAKYTFYLWPAEAGPGDPAVQPYEVGTSCFPFPPSNGTPAPPPYTIANNIGFRSLLGIPLFVGVPAAGDTPVTVFQYSLLPPGSYTFQGLIMDDGASSSLINVSITNAVMVNVVP